MNTTRLLRLRRTVQWVTLLGVCALPFLGGVQINVEDGRLLLFGRQIGFGDAYLMLGGLGLMLSVGALLFYPLGQSFCGWMCPQNTVSELMGGLLQRLLGRHASDSLDPQKGSAHTGRRGLARVAAWLAFACVVLVISVVATGTVLHYYHPTSELLENLSNVAHHKTFWAFAVMLLVLFVLDFGLFRHVWCKYMCVAGLIQSLFRGRDTLQIRFDTARADDCRSCSLCQEVCPVDLDPRQPEVDTRCFNCGICIDACDSYLGRFDKPRLLNFGMGTRAAQLIRIEGGKSPLWSGRTLWPLAGMALSITVLLVGLSQSTALGLSLQAQRPEPGGTGIRFSAEVVNHKTTAATYTVRVEGLPPGQIQMGRTTITLAAGERLQLPLRVTQEGLANDRPYPISLVFTDTASGAVEQVSATYFMPG